MPLSNRVSIPVLAAALALAACNPKAEQPQAEATGPQEDVYARAGSAGAEWLTYGGTYDEQRHSSLKGIAPANVAQLGVAWTYDLNSNRGIEATPIVHDGVMYVTSSWSILHALDARTGQELWVYDPGADRSVGVDACCDVVNRGVAIKDGVLFLGVIDGRLEAIDAKSGKRIWSVQTVDRSKPYTVTGAPRVVKDMVLIGNGGAELGVRGYLSAYDVKSGKLVWRFYTVPNPKMQPDGAASDRIFASLANASWGRNGQWTKDGGGGTVWDSIVYDTQNDQIVFGVGNGSPWNAQLRDPDGRGDNLFLSSIVAVDADSGRYKWHFQTTPRDNWDYTATQTIILAELPLGENGAPRRVVMQAPKNGFFYVLDARSGQFLSGKGYVPQNWTTGLDANGRPVETATARPVSGSSLLLPGPQGGHNWHPMAYNPELKLAYIPAQELPQGYAPKSKADPRTKWNTGFGFEEGMTVDPLDPATLKGLRAAYKGRLIAWDPVRQEARWTVEQPTPSNGGVLSTASGLVFQGLVGGDLVAYDAATGKPLWRHNVKAGIAAPPVTYELDGEQYLAVASGWGGAYALSAGFLFDKAVQSNLGRVIAFKLGAQGSVPDHGLLPVRREPQAAAFGDPAMLQRGFVAYSRNCMVCHGPMAISSGVLPDLRWAPTTGDAEAWSDVVRHGSRASNGMVGFAKLLSPADSEAIRAYVVHQSLNAPDGK
ncbi:PQQ-dependent dehydrogenase, methanol/ethanol family [Sandaracinobacter sp. RS1-74]|uniref:PQQ-dependent dehydrogenase, methanol/ethanol family n=1 Tax=Sandaracinobacteroides sayramensis TaxID=2913411 RepID=UPI001EDBEDDA|nr:PQQ-dependent dehydrogenase, methanol/ethanol family [Sandaracinobacteroides sayramensis]MCG2841550.1 PQQ-dependent dehydrogenase, methanol/ethanol family [Sandaracinobacteroides sayramensis]